MLKETGFEVLKYDEFLLTMKEVVKEMVDDKYSVEINHVIKNNSIELDGLTIFGADIIITPNIYLNAYYERYMEGEELSDLAVEIVRLYEMAMKEGEREKINITYELEEMKPFIVYRLVNYKKNQKLLQEIPHLNFLDLAITFHCLVKDCEEGIGTIRITNEHLERWNTNLKEIERLAIHNTPRLFPYQMRGMNEVIKDIFRKEMRGMEDIAVSYNETQSEESIEQAEENMMQTLIDAMEQRKSEEMYVLTNYKGINGASCLLYPEILDQIGDKLNADFYILPSSIHELILIIDNGKMNPISLREMVCEVNQTQVAADEVLSDQVYYYSREKQRIYM
jgi:hypothetical protein